MSISIGPIQGDYSDYSGALPISVYGQNGKILDERKKSWTES